VALCLCNSDTVVLHCGHDVTVRVVGNEAVLLAAESGQYFGLNEVGRFIWEKLNDGSTCEEIALQLASEYGIPEPEARTDVMDFVNSLEKSSLVTR